MSNLVKADNAAIEQIKNSFYVEHGYKNRAEYLDSLAQEYEVDPYVVYSLASVLGQSEDFDGLVIALDDAGGDLWQI